MLVKENTSHKASEDQILTRTTQEVFSDLLNGKIIYKKARLESRHKKYQCRKQEETDRIQISNYKKHLTERPAYCPTNNRQGDVLDSNTNIWMSYKEPYMSKRDNLMVPQRVLEHGLKDILCGTRKNADGTSFPRLKLENLSSKEQHIVKQSEIRQQQICAIQYQQLVDSQTGQAKKLAQQKRYAELKHFRRAQISPDLFNRHPTDLNDVPRTINDVSRIIQIDRNFEKTVWSIPSKFSNQFDDSLIKPYVSIFSQTAARNVSKLEI